MVRSILLGVRGWELGLRHRERQVTLSHRLRWELKFRIDDSQARQFSGAYFLSL